MAARIPGTPPPSCGAASPGIAHGALFAAAVVLGPGLLLWHLHGLWNPDGAYAYGWAVPLLAAFLCKSRWEDRPTPSAPIRAAAFWAIVFALATLPAHWLQEAAPERSICAWTFAIGSIGISLALLSLAGGAAWLRWFSFPLAFILTAVPWPHGLEIVVSNYLMHGTAGATVEILCLIGVPAAQAGNLVHIETGVIDIDEACSGIRSLQAMVMISLFLGELFRLKPARRLWLMVVGLSVTLLANVIRTTLLSNIAFNHGMAALDHYHDAAGFAVLLLSLSITLLTAFLLRPSRIPAPIPGASAAGLALPLRLTTALLIWLIVAEISVEVWYRLHEPKWQGWSWDVRWPQQNKDFQFIEIPKRSLRLLMCDEAHAATWKEPEGRKWALYQLRWKPGNVQAEAAKVHRPDVCLNAEGAIIERDLGTHVSSIGGIQLPFHSYTFGLNDQTLYVFFCLYEEIPGHATIASNPQFEGVDMFERALQGRRHIGQQSLEIALAGYNSERSAQEAFKARLGELMQIREGAGVPAAE